MDGTYNISATINISIDNVTLNGNGSNTALVRQWDTYFGGSTTSTFPLIYCNSKCEIINLIINGNNYFNMNNYGIYINLYKAKCKIENCFLINNYCGIYVGGTTTGSSISTCYFYIINNYFANNQRDIYIVFDAASGKILNNFFDHNLLGFDIGDSSIKLNSGGNTSGLYNPYYIIISNNEFIEGGISSNCNYTIFSNNIFTEIDGDALQINGYYGYNNIINGNIVIAKDDSIAINNGISLNNSSQYNLVTNNQLINGAIINNKGTNNTIINNITTP